MKNDDAPKSIKKKILLHDLFPEFTSDESLALIEKWEKKNRTVKTADGKERKVKSETIILPDEQEIILPDDFDIRALMKSAEDPVTGAVRNLKIDDRDLPHAKNFYDYSYRIIGKDANPPWARQMWTGLMVFGEICTACTKKKYVEDIMNIPKNMNSEEITDVMTILDHGVCPKCKRHKWDLIKNFNLKDYIQLVAVLGQRSGKSSSSSGSYASYMTHSYLKFPDLATMAPKEMQASTELTGTFVSLNFNKANGVMWTPYKRMIEDSKWFQEYFKILDHAKEVHGKEFYRRSTLYMSILHKNMRFYPTGPRSTTLRGDTRLFALLDELGLFKLPKGDSEEDGDSEMANADEAHKSLMNSLTTAQTIRWRLLQEGVSSVPSSLMMSVSSPYSLRDKVMRLLRESRTPEGSKYILGVNLPTWEANPGIERDTPIIAAAYASNPEKAERDYGANPPTVHSRFVPVKAYQSGVFVNGQNSHTFTHLFDQPGYIYGKVERIRTFRFPSVVSIDAGLNNNSFTITGQHYDFDTGKTVGTTIIECMPQDGRNVNFNLLYTNVILPVCKDLNAVALLADQWQGIDILHRIEIDMGNNPLGKTRCKAVQYSPKRRDFDAVVSMMSSGNILLPTINSEDQQRITDGQIENYRTEMVGKPVQHLYLQLNTVQDTGPSRCPGKGDGYTDDIFRSLVLGVSKVHHEKVMARLTEARDFVYEGQGNRSRMPPPAFAGRSGGYGKPFR